MLVLGASTGPVQAAQPMCQRALHPRLHPPATSGLRWTRMHVGMRQCSGRCGDLEGRARRARHSRYMDALEPQRCVHGRTLKNPPFRKRSVFQLQICFSGFSVADCACAKKLELRRPSNLALGSNVG